MGKPLAIEMAVVWLCLAGLPVHADTPIATYRSPIKKAVCIPPGVSPCPVVDFGAIAVKLGSDPIDATMVAGFNQLFKDPRLCFTINVLQVVLEDSNPPRGWKDARGTIHPPTGNIEPPYVDPLSGGNIPPGKTNVPPGQEADRLPFYDGTRQNVKASNAGNFGGEDHPEYDLSPLTDSEGNDVSKDVWVDEADPTLELCWADRVPLMNEVKFLTMVVCVKDKKICPIAGYIWGHWDNAIHLEEPFEGSNYPNGLNKDTVQNALNKSGFNEYTMVDECCVCPVPEPTSLYVLLGGLCALSGVFFRRNAQLVLPIASAARRRNSVEKARTVSTARALHCAFSDPQATAEASRSFLSCCRGRAGRRPRCRAPAESGGPS